MDEKSSLVTTQEKWGGKQRVGGQASIHLFVCFWPCWVFVAACGLSLVVTRGVGALLSSYPGVTSL